MQMKTSDITFGQWTISCEESLTYPDKIWAVYSITHQNELFEIGLRDLQLQGRKGDSIHSGNVGPAGNLCNVAS